MIPVGDSLKRHRAPLVTWTLIALNVLIYLWDRNGSLFGSSAVFTDLSMTPREVLQSWPPFQPDRGWALVTLFTAMFLHVNLVHLLGNMIYLLVFGSTLEVAMGSWRYLLYYLFWGVAAWAAHIFVQPMSDVPTLGASGAIGGVLGAYFLLFPSNKIELFIPFLPWLEFETTAWLLLGFWFLFQVLVPQAGVANWAHAGGFMAGMLSVLAMGGRREVLRQAAAGGMEVP